MTNQKKQSIQTTLFGETVISEDCDDEPIDEFKEIKIEEFIGEHKCPLCGFEWDD